MERAHRAGAFGRIEYNGALFECFVPAKLPPQPEIVLDDELKEALIQSDRDLRDLCGFAAEHPELERFLPLFRRKEALLSIQLEARSLEAEDAFGISAGAEKDERAEEIDRYESALSLAQNAGTGGEARELLLYRVNELLCGGSGGLRKRGEWKEEGLNGMREASFTIPPAELLGEAYRDLLLYSMSPGGLPGLVKTALCHYQFMAVHPFTENNGRTDRIFTYLDLADKGLLTTGLVCLSYDLKQNPIEYYDRMSRAQSDGEFEEWILFFVRGIGRSARESLLMNKRLLQIRERELRLIESRGYGEAELRGIRELYDAVCACPVMTREELSGRERAQEALLSLGILRGSERRGIAVVEHARILPAISGGTENWFAV